MREGRFVPFGRSAAIGFTAAGIAFGVATVVVVIV